MPGRRSHITIKLTPISAETMRAAAATFQDILVKHLRRKMTLAYRHPLTFHPLTRKRKGRRMKVSDLPKKLQPSPRDQDLHVVGHTFQDSAAKKSWRWLLVFKRTVLADWPTQTAAITAGRTEARQRSCDLVIHGKNGRIREKNSYGSDPKRRKG